MTFVQCPSFDRVRVRKSIPSHDYVYLTKLSSIGASPVQTILRQSDRKSIGIQLRQAIRYRSNSEDEEEDDLPLGIMLASKNDAYVLHALERVYPLIQHIPEKPE